MATTQPITTQSSFGKKDVIRLNAVPMFNIRIVVLVGKRYRSGTLAQFCLREPE